jgi:hypothetical protein
MSNLEHRERLLRKVKLDTGGGATVEWLDTYWNPETQGYVKNSESRTSDGAIHADFVAAMTPLREHLAIRCEYVPEVKANHPFTGTLKGCEKFKVGSVVFRGGEHDPDSEEERSPIQVQLFGLKRLADGRVTNFGTPGIKLGAPQEPYKFSTQLDEHIQRVEAEAWAYLDGKVAPPAQQALALDEEPIEETADLGEEK